MEKDRLVGAGILLASIVVAIFYALLLYFGHGSILAIILVSMAFFAPLGVVSWIGLTIATAPTSKPVELETLSEVRHREETREEGPERGRRDRDQKIRA
jgi:hypothetical protein